MRNVVASFAVALELLVGAVAPAQTRPLIEPPDFVLSQWTTADGLPQNSVTAIAQTPDGYLWLGTFGGVARFDGSSFRLAPRVDSAGQHTDRVLSLAVGRDSALWIGTEAGLLRYHGGRYDVYTTANGLPDGEISALHVDGTGVLWIGTARGGVARFERGAITRVPASNGAPVSYVFSFVETGDGTIWVNLPNNYLTVGREHPDTARIPRDRLSESLLLEE